MLIGLNLFNGDAGAMKRQSAACDAPNLVNRTYLQIRNRHKELRR